MSKARIFRLLRKPTGCDDRLGQLQTSSIWFLAWLFDIATYIEELCRIRLDGDNVAAVHQHFHLLSFSQLHDGNFGRVGMDHADATGLRERLRVCYDNIQRNGFSS